MGFLFSHCECLEPVVSYVFKTAFLGSWVGYSSCEGTFVREARDSVKTISISGVLTKPIDPIGRGS